MTREEQIAKAASSNATLLEQYGFKAGARWADAHPQSPWVSVKEKLPSPYENVYVAGLTGRGMGVGGVDYINANGKWQYYVGVDYWMPIPELPKGGEK